MTVWHSSMCKAAANETETSGLQKKRGQNSSDILLEQRVLASVLHQGHHKRTGRTGRKQVNNLKKGRKTMTDNQSYTSTHVSQWDTYTDGLVHGHVASGQSHFETGREAREVPNKGHG